MSVRLVSERRASAICRLAFTPDHSRNPERKGKLSLSKFTDIYL